MEKVNTKFINNSYSSAISNYIDATNKIGLWESEEYIFNKYFEKSKKILDIGCGTGRTTFGLYELGYKNIVGLDLSDDMLSSAREISENKGYNIKFIEGNVMDLDFIDNSLYYALFSFNGIMQIPKKDNRIKALKEIKRVLKPNGIFIFTTHDRNRGEEFIEYWKSEKEKWDKGEQDKRLHEYGDRITTSKNENSEIFIHIPDRKELAESIKKSGLKIVEDFYRSDKFDENEKVKKFSGECRFWVVKG